MTNITRANLINSEHAQRLALHLTELQCVLLITVAELGSITIKRPRSIEGDAFELYDASCALAWSRPINLAGDRASMVTTCIRDNAVTLTIDHLGRDVACAVVERLTKS